VENAYLLATDKVVVDGILEQFLSQVVFASPTPQVLVAIVTSATFHDRNSCCPYGETKDKGGSDKNTSMRRDALGFVVTAGPVAVHDVQRQQERQ
jgi:hypothetical protein